METKVYIDDGIASKWRELAMKRFGYGRGSISKAAEEALAIWIRQEENIGAALEKLKELSSKEKSIDALLLFGSYARKEAYNDIDMAVLLTSGSNRLKVISKLESVAPESPKFDFSFFNEMPLSMKGRVLSECIVAYMRPGFDLKGLSVEQILKWSDIKPMLNAALV